MGMMTAIAIVAALLRPPDEPLDPEALRADCVEEVLADVLVDVVATPDGVIVNTGCVDVIVVMYGPFCVGLVGA